MRRFPGWCGSGFLGRRGCRGARRLEGDRRIVVLRGRAGQGAGRRRIASSRRGGAGGGGGGA
ncbi:MAG: hypothetical protein U0841_15125 [Chloroflexia bacterium]